MKEVCVKRREEEERTAMAKKQNISPKLRAMAEYGSSGIWASGGMIEHHALGLSSELAQRFDDWIAEYTSLLEHPVLSELKLYLG